jgi:hypothetical protein
MRAGPDVPAADVPPVAVTAARLHGLDEYAGFDVAPELGAGWVALGHAERDGQLDAWLAASVSRHSHRGAAGSLLAAELTHVVVGPTVSAMVLDGRCPDPAVDNLADRVDGEGNLERSAVLSPRAAVLAGDAASADRHSVVLPDEAALDRWWAQRVAATLTPLLAAVRARAPFGLRGLWGAVSDEVTGTAIWIAQLAGEDPHPAWRRAQRLLDALAARAPVALTRAQPFPVAYPGGRRLFQVRGTCCLYYRSAAAADDGPAGDRYCNTCPLRRDDSRQRRLRDYLITTSSPDATTA